MIEKLSTLWPEVTLLIAATLTMILGVSPKLAVRRLCAPIAGVALAIAGVLAFSSEHTSVSMMPNLSTYGTVLAAGVGLLLLLLVVGLPDRAYEARLARNVSRSGAFDALRNTRGEFYAFFLFSIAGLMLCASADDLIWLFLALELVSLPTYVMVTMSTPHNRSMEAGVKYFFLGAMGAATFLYGFALIYGATGTTYLPKIAELFQAQMASGGLSGLAVAGLVLSIIGICFKIAAVPMHFYTADVYQGAHSAVTAFLAFVPKTAGFFALILLLSLVGWSSTDATSSGLPQPMHTILWITAALTMTVGNVLAVLQTSIKRIFAYSSIAHSGYMLVGLIAGPGPSLAEGGAPLQSSGLAAVLFYLLAYGVTNVAAFAVLSSLEKSGKLAGNRGRATDADSEPVEVDSISDLRGLCSTSPLLGWTMVIACVGLLGLPPLLGFFSKMPLLTSGVRAGEYGLVVILVLNSAIAAFYYLRIAGSALLESPDLSGASTVRPVGIASRPIAGLLAAACVVGLSFYPVMDAARWGGKFLGVGKAESTPAAKAVPGAAPGQSDHQTPSPQASAAGGR